MKHVLPPDESGAELDDDVIISSTLRAWQAQYENAPRTAVRTVEGCHSAEDTWIIHLVHTKGPAYQKHHKIPSTNQFATSGYLMAQCWFWVVFRPHRKPAASSAGTKRIPERLAESKQKRLNMMFLFNKEKYISNLDNMFTFPCAHFRATYIFNVRCV